MERSKDREGRKDIDICREIEREDREVEQREIWRDKETEGDMEKIERQ